MSRLNRLTLTRIFLIGLVVIAAGAVIGCSNKPNHEEVSKLEESRSAAESAERKLAELRQERIKLENELKAKQGELNKIEQVKDSLKNKVN
jgi:septal ring factor EnvC (AmiA/AmiB activator)